MNNSKDDEDFEYLYHLIGSVKDERDKFPVQLPVYSHNKEIGILNMDFILNEKQLYAENVKQEEILLSSLFMLKELSMMGSFIQTDLDLISKMVIKFDQKISKLQRLTMFMAGPGRIRYSEYWNNILLAEDDLFDFILLEGPHTLRISFVQEFIHLWLSDKKKSGTLIDKLKNSLLQYGLGSSPKEFLFDLGRRKLSLINHFEQEDVENRYHDIRALLKIVKRNKKEYGDVIDKFFMIAEKEFLRERKNESRWKTTYKYSRKCNTYGHFEIVWSCINSEASLKMLCLSFSWEPNHLARKVLAKLLEVSESTLKNYLKSPK